MLHFVDHMFIGLRCRAIKAAEAFKEESGVSSFVATVLLIVIVVGLTALFWKEMKSWFETDLWPKITGNASNIGNTP